MHYRFITVIHFLKLEKPDCRIPLSSGMISNKADLLKDVLSYRCKISLHTLGVHSIDEFHDQTFYVVDGDFEADVTKPVVDAIGTSLTFAFLRQIQCLTNDFWMVRDNSIYVRDGFLFIYDRDIEDGVTFKASLSTINSKASARIEDVVFSKEEIMGLAQEMQMIPMEDVLAGRNYREASQFQYFKSSKLGRKTTAWVYLLQGRAASALTIKVLMYITAMEALVSTSTVELSHQVAERIALLLGKDAVGRCEIYNVIKKGYGVRSKTAHGEPLKGTEADVVALLTRLDDYLRSLFKLDKPYDLDVDKMNEYYIKRLLGDDIAPRINDTRLE